MPRQKLTQVVVLPEVLYGQSDYCRAEVQVNIQYIWQETKDEKKFMQEFALTYTHEFMHLLIEEILDELLEFGEEKVIRSMLGERWTRKLQKYYATKIIKGRYRGKNNGKEKGKKASKKK